MQNLGPEVPKSSNFAISQSSNISCLFAHTRLAILDLSPAGHQPMTSEDGRYTIVYNGEVFNFREIRAELENLSNRAIEQSSNRPFRSNSDTEVILRSYEKWGADCVRRFRGMFAFAIWDRDDRSLFMARDRLGIKPLYYVEHSGGVAFCSEIRPFLEAGLVERRLDSGSLGSYFAFGSVSGPGTIIEKVRALSPGSTAILRAGRLTVQRYWSPPQTEWSRPSDGRLALEELRATLREAVRMRLISDVPLGVFLSGGIDSSAVVALAAAASDTPIHTFTVTFDEQPYNEETFAAEIASRFGCDHHQVHLSAARAASEIEGAVRALDQPSADGVNTYFVAKAAREAGLTVALSGLGGDEIFAGYPYFRSFGSLLRMGAAARFLPHRVLTQGPEAFNGMPHRSRKLRALLSAGGDPAKTYAVLRGMFLTDERDSLLAPDLRSAAAAEASNLSDVSVTSDSGAPWDPVNVFSKLEIANYLRNTLLRDTDTMSMAHSLEVRVPLLDHRLVEHVLALPGRIKIAGRHNKPLLTGAVPEVPEPIVRRRKMGFTLPMEVWFRGAQREWLSELLSESSIEPLGFLNPRGVNGLWRSFLRGEKFTSWSRVWCVAALVAWSKQNRVGL